MMLDTLAPTSQMLNPVGARIRIMGTRKHIARHVFHPATSGTDRLHAWQEATGEPFFVWGKDAGGTGSTWFGSVKRAFRQWLADTGTACMTIYHDGMGADVLGPMDHEEHKVLFLHSWFPRWEKNFEWMLRCTGKVLVNDPAMTTHVRGKFAWIPGKYIHAITGPGLREKPPEGGSGAKARTGIWLLGNRWKRFGNRLRSIVDHWPEQTGELEIVTNGKAPAWSQKPFVKWSADLPFQFALMRLHTWDSCLLLNDFALDQPWLVRAIELGCFPIVPEGSAHGLNVLWGQDSAPKPYQWGDMEDAIALLLQWRRERDRLNPEFTKWASLVVNRHNPAGFPATWNDTKSQIVSSRPPSLRSRKPAGSLVPVAWYERVQRLRAGL